MMTRRVSLQIDGVTLDWFTSVRISRDLTEISGSFELEMRDPARSLQTWPYATPDNPFLPPVNWGGRATLSIDNEAVLTGWIDEVNPRAGDCPSLSICGRDVTGDLVDCSASPSGPTEFKGLNLMQIAERVCKPFGIKVSADVDVGKTFNKFTLDCGETAMSAIEKGARQRALLVVSDGVGGLVLTRSGKGRAGGTLNLPGNLITSCGKFSARERYSDYYVKGQAEQAGGRRAARAGLDATAQPLGGGDTTASDAADGDHEAAGVTIQGHAQDKDIRRYRPLVSQARTQATAACAQQQADWMMRTARGKGSQVDCEVRDWRVNGQLWRPNELVYIDDAFQDIARDMLICGVEYSYSDAGESTALRLIGPEAFDLIPEGEEETGSARKRSRARSGTGKLDGTAQELGDGHA